MALRIITITYQYITSGNEYSQPITTSAPSHRPCHGHVFQPFQPHTRSGRPDPSLNKRLQWHLKRIREEKRKNHSHAHIEYRNFRFNFRLHWQQPNTMVHLRFQYHDVIALCQYLNIPEYYKLDNRGKVESLTAFVMLLYALVRPRRLIDLSGMFGCHISVGCTRPSFWTQDRRFASKMYIGAHMVDHNLVDRMCDAAAHKGSVSLKYFRAGSKVYAFIDGNLHPTARPRIFQSMRKCPGPLDKVLVA
ncbi:hypothetical protein BCR44DRAFT_308961 [Catenaria anguillulae PL171]|uniref:Uncharacterized protein n=1 Tax=Catenaria anguillulae PL171 TaxID=765915 RepID=A0A1Y2HUG1_9FUNG|nr:hypothetical protein BCR44DRAFT_308961 [Catenaria anguillulae PL171]